MPAKDAPSVASANVDGLPEKAREWLERCEAGVPGYCRNLGLLYEDGDGVALDLPKARALYQRACDAGDFGSCANLGRLYAEDNGGPATDAKAAKLFAKGCGGHDALSCSSLGSLYAEGRGVPASVSRAVELFGRSCEGGAADGCTKLGVQHEKGEGVARDAARAVELYRRGCDGGDGYGCYYLGINLAQGIGVPSNAAAAATALQKGCSKGHADSCRMLSERPSPRPVAGTKSLPTNDASRMHSEAPNSKRVAGTKSLPTNDASRMHSEGPSSRREHHLGVPLALIGLCFLALGLRGLVMRTPLVASSRWWLALLIPFGLLWAESSGITLTFNLAPFQPRVGLPWLVLAGVAVGAWFVKLRGYSVCGSTRQAMGSGLHAALASLGLKYESTGGIIDVPSLGVEIRCVNLPWLGCAQFHVKRSRETEIRIAGAMRAFFRLRAPDVVAELKRACGLQCSLGLIIVAIAWLIGGP